jgi:photosystem II stability/assembly factor-like uncharacterized protein
MFDERSGWGISQTSVLRTADSATTWHTAGPSTGEASGYTVTSYFLDAAHGWILVPVPNDMLHGILYRSSDGGVSWMESPAPFGDGQLHFVDARRGWMMATLGAGAGSMGIAVFQTQDGGATWTQSYTNDPNQPEAGSSLPLGGLKNGIAATSIEKAWIGGVTYAPGTVYLYQTVDGGRSWTKSPVQDPAGYEQAELQTAGPVFVDAGIAYLPVHLSSQNGVLLAIYLSRDGGASWLLSPELIPQGGPMDFVSAQTGFVWNGTNFYATKDAAQSWTVVTPDLAFGDTFSGMDFVTPQVGFVLRTDASGIASLYKTVDGAATWTLAGN